MTSSLKLSNEEHKYFFHINRKSQRLNLLLKGKKKKKVSSEMGEVAVVAKKTQHHKQTKTQPFFFVKNIGS